MIKKLFAVFCSLIFLIPAIGCEDANGSGVVVLDSVGTAIATPTISEFPDDDLLDPLYRSYIKFALDESADILAKLLDCSKEQAEVKLLRGGYTVKTEFDSNAFNALNKMYEEGDIPSVGASILGADANLLALYSGGKTLLATEAHAPFSTIKPLGVYAPAIEAGLLSWSTPIFDKPYTTIENQDGTKEPWPTNPTGVYSYSNILPVEFIRQSLNTASVWCLKMLGVKNSLLFLDQKLGIDVEFEKSRFTSLGEEEIIGNIALGYLNTGLTPTELAGCYQIFGRGGKYIKPWSVSTITDKNQNIIYTHETVETRVISEETAYIMNRLLTYVITPGATGEKASFGSVEVAGKTGTGADKGGNWFVGITPEYSCAIFHETVKNTPNSAAALFRAAMKAMPKHEKTKFDSCSGVRKTVLCSKTGKKYSNSCTNMQIGYYVGSNSPALCDGH